MISIVFNQQIRKNDRKLYELLSLGCDFVEFSFWIVCGIVIVTSDNSILSGASLKLTWIIFRRKCQLMRERENKWNQETNFSYFSRYSFFQRKIEPTNWKDFYQSLQTYLIPILKSVGRCWSSFIKLSELYLRALNVWFTLIKESKSKIEKEEEMKKTKSQAWSIQWWYI